MIVFPNAKINLGLQILRKREDGFHDIRSVLVPVPLSDVLELFVVDAETGEDSEAFQSMDPVHSEENLDFFLTGIDVDGDIAQNLCVKAARLYREHFPVDGKIWMHLHKIIPTGAGLGGGSSDAAFVLTTLDTLTGNRATAEQLAGMAASLGSDCSFFLRNKPACATGKGDLLSPADLDLTGYRICILKPEASVSTAEAYAAAAPLEEVSDLMTLLKKTPASWQEEIKNDFEEWAVSRIPEIGTLISALRNSGAFYVAMSGSGSAVFGLYNKDIPELELPSGTFSWKGVLK
jgi:4-diphosphocytidyl-2-C-methyl-D-erythritol kinase